jgi:hypothetical protein
MNVSPFAIQLTIAVILLLAVMAWTLRFALRAGEGTAGPIIRALAKELRKGWYQIDMRIANRAPYGLTSTSLRHVRPRTARLMAPIKPVSTRRSTAMT